MNSFFPNSPRNRLNTVSASDIQYQLCSSFMKFTGDELIQKQLQMMMETNTLLDQINPSFVKPSSNISFDGEKDVSTAIDIQNLQTLLNVDDEEPVKRPRMFSRKGGNSTINTTNSSKFLSQISISKSLQEIKENCSKRTVAVVNSLITERKKLEQKISQFKSEKRIPLLQPKKNDATNYLDQILQLKDKNTKFEQQNILLKSRMKELQEKIEGFNKNTIASSPQSFIISQNLTKRATLFEETCNKIGEHQNSIINCISRQFVEEGCERCCGMMKKIKTSLMNYRKSLEEIMGQHEQLIENWKKSFVQKNKMS